MAEGDRPGDQPCMDGCAEELACKICTAGQVKLACQRTCDDAHWKDFRWEYVVLRCIYIRSPQESSKIDPAPCQLEPSFKAQSLASAFKLHRRVKSAASRFGVYVKMEALAVVRYGT